ncbi:Rrf2 family transcriptional regulator [Agromyces sp. H66]|uniref:RrF2 family transcriptional regulator n=1 Tax=Agromyces sp. H66 TaxID=2529859 RepID=UPI0020BD9DC5|nr:Rrf2 family transcriptional regulator [Agromyces sp. H66]
MSEGVEWALHTCLNLSWVPEGEAKTTAQVAAFYDLPPAYLNKQLQALVRAGILTSVSGPRGGFRLAREPDDVSLLDVVVAIEGRTEAFACANLLAEGPGGDPSVDYAVTCILSQAMSRADLAWRRELASRTLGDIRRDVEQAYPGTPEATRDWFANARPARRPTIPERPATENTIQNTERS